MCILCVVQRWSRRVATMLPWLVIPLIVLWALSQLLPPALRFEITSPRLACVAVLLATLFWYEILMPHLSSWRARRAARLRERRRTEALELQKRRKTATRHCRNCHLPYRNQTPGGGRFMCSYCGHISKKPVLGPTAGRGMISDYVGKHNWLCDADGNCNSVGSVPKYWSGSDHRCSAEMSYSGVMVFSCKLLSFFFSSMRWLCGKFFRLGLSQEDRSCDLDHRGPSRKGEIAGNFKESRGEKARRKAEEKRQARLEKEMLEEEERKQKEEVARLVEERRRLRYQKMVAEKDRSKGSSLDGDRDDLKEIDRKRYRRKDKDKSSCKSNSDGEELEKRTSWQNERKHEFVKKGENERFDQQKNMAVNCKSHALHGVYGSKVSLNKPRYFDGMKGTFLSSSRGFGGSSFFGRNTQKSASVAKSVKTATGFVDHAQNTVKRRDAVPVSYVGKSASGAGENAYEASLTQPAATYAQPKTVCKMSWHQLFTRSSAVSPDPDSNPITYKTEQLLARGDQQSHQNFPPGYCKTYNQVQFGKASPFVANRPTSTLFISNPISHVVPETTFSPLKVPLQSSVSEDADLLENPCHVPDPMSLLGPVSESLDNFPLDLESEFAKTKTEQYPLLNSAYASAEMNKPLPIEPPLSKLHLPEEIHTKSDQFFCTPSPDVSTSRPEQSTWQMWGNPWSQDGLGLVGSPSSLFPIVGQNNSQLQDDVLHSLPHKPIKPLISNNNNIQHVHTNNHQQIGGACSHLGPSLNGNGIWLKNSPFQSPLQVYEDDRLLPLNLMDDITHSEAAYSSPNKSTAVNSFETQQAFSWSPDDLVSHAPQEAVNLKSVSANVGSLFSRGPDAPSLWSFNQ